MKRLLLTLAVATSTAGLAIACGGEELDAAPMEMPPEFVPGPEVDTSEPSPPEEMATPEEEEPPSSDAGADAAPANDKCAKHLTVIETVGVPGVSKWKTNGCWTIVNADGASKGNDYRKCSTVNFKMTNAGGTSYAYDDTSPSHNLTQEKNYLAECSKGATGDGLEYMAYRGGWRPLAAPRLKAYFAELYGSSTSDMDSLWFKTGVYKNNTTLKKITNVYPMINFGLPKTAAYAKKIENDSYVICKTVKDGGYFGVYNAAWQSTWEADDIRLVALERAINKCTEKQ